MSATAVVKFGSNYVMQLDDKPGVLYWTSGLHVDADGSPHAYHPNGSPPGLDYLANAGKPGDWWGIACNSIGLPYVQTASDPAPGFYVSTTALEDPDRRTSDPTRYVNSETIPFIVLPSKPKFSPLQQLGDVALCFHNKTGKSCAAVYADIGPQNQIGEGSMALNKALGLNPSPKIGGTDSEDIATIYWPGSKIAWPATPEETGSLAWFLFMEWGGFATAKVALPQFNWDQFTMPTPQPTPAEQPVVTIAITVPKDVIVNVIQNPSPVS